MEMTEEAQTIVPRNKDLPVKPSAPVARQNINETERWVSAIAGAALGVYGLRQNSLGGLVMAALGGSMIHRGVSGHCHLYQALKIDTSEKPAHPAQRSFHLDKSIVVQRPIHEVYQFWHNFENLPRFMAHLESVKCIDEKHSYWIARGPMGQPVEWGATIINDREDEVIAWQSLPDADIFNAGSVRFRQMPDGRGTEVRIVINYTPPAGMIGYTVAKLLGEEPGQQVEADLRSFKSVMEKSDAEITEEIAQPGQRRMTD